VHCRWRRVYWSKVLTFFPFSPALIGMSSDFTPFYSRSCRFYFHRLGQRFLEWLFWRRKITKSVWRLNLERVRVCGQGGRLLWRSSTVCLFSFSRALSQKSYSLRTVAVFLPTGKVCSVDGNGFLVENLIFLSFLPPVNWYESSFHPLLWSQL